MQFVNQLLVFNLLDFFFIKV